MNRAERRQYAKRINTPQKLEQFSRRFDNDVRKEYEKIYEEKYEREVEDTIENFLIAITYCLHFSEKTKFGKNRLKEFLDDLLVTVDMFKKGEFSPDDYRKALIEDGIEIISSKKRKEEEK